MHIEQTLSRALGGLDHAALRADYATYNELVWRERMLPPDLVAQLTREAVELKPSARRRHIPGYKKSGSVSYHQLAEAAPTIMSLYRDPSFIALFASLAGSPLVPCPDEDPHACALYYYTEPGDRIGFHYDSSHYEGERYTVLVGLVNRSRSELVCHPYRKMSCAQLELRISTAPGTVVFFNGGNIWHSVSPVGEGEERIVLTLEYVTDPTMSAARRLLSNVKDAVTYFGFKEVWSRRRAPAR